MDYQTVKNISMEEEVGFCEDYLQLILKTTKKILRHIEDHSRYTIDRNKRLGKYISLEYYGFPKRDNANRLDQKRLNIISKRDIIGDSGIGRLLRRENGVPLS